MKQLSFITIFIFFIVLSSNPVEALTPSPTQAGQTKAATQAPVQEKLETQIDELKEKIASRVSELNLVEKRGMVGVISEVSGNKITVTDVNGKKRLVDVDEITEFSSVASKNFGLSDLKKGTRVTILGLYNKQSERILARFIEITVTPVVLSGAVSQVDAKNFQFIILSEDQKETSIDVATTTKLSAYSKDEPLAKLGFSKITVGDRVVVIGYPSKTDPKLIVASRATFFPGLPQNPKIVVAKPSEEVASEALTPLPTKKITPAKTQQ